MRPLVLVALALALAAPALASEQHPTLAELEGELICPTCHTGLDQSDSPIALRIKAFIRARIAAGDTKSEIKDKLVAQFGLAVLAAAAALGIGAGRLSDNRSASPLLAAHPAPAQRRVIHEQTVRLKLPQSPGITGWSILWTRQKRSIPDRTVDLPGGARAAVSPVFTYGVMYFHFRARRLDGSWTPAQHQGPYRVGGGHRIASP